MIITCLSLAAIAALLFIYFISRRRYNYWEKRNVPFEKPALVFGNFADYILLRKYWGHVTQKLCKKFSNEPYFGAFYGTEPTLVVQDPEIIKLVTTKDFYYFSSREISKYTHRETITQNLFFTQGDRWKVMRQNLTPLFSSSKMKNMFYLIEKCSKTFEKMLDDEFNKSKVIDLKSEAIPFTMDCITSCAFGVNGNVMGKESNDNPFKIMGDLIFEISNYRGFTTVARAIWPYIFYGLGFKNFPIDIEKFFNKLLSGVLQDRGYKASTRNDFVDLMLNLRKNKFISGDSLSNLQGEKKRIDIEVTDELLISQCVVFFAAGFETSASTVTFTLFELAKNEEAQKRAFEEVVEYLKKNNGKVAYNCVTDLPYLEACVDEALRLYPVLGVLTREVVEDYTLPTGLVLEKGLRVHIPVYHLQHSSDFFPDPEEYRPERFLGDNKKDVAPYTYMPFGDGPRICIGMRFAKMQILAGLVTILKKYQLKLADDMPRTVEFEPKAIVTQPVGSIRFKLSTRPGWEQRMYKDNES